MTDNKKVQLLKKIIESDTLPSLSPLAIRLIELASDDSSSATDLAYIIEKDPGLTARLLKLVGSAFFSRAETVTSISQAVVLVGFKKVRIMALSLSLRDAFPMDKAKGMDYRLFWKTSLYRALIAQDLVLSGGITGGVYPEEAFMAGLIAEIGMLLLFSQCPEDKKEGFPGGSASLENTIAWEENTFGLSHRDLGSVVLRRWRFPEALVESQKFYGAEALETDAPALSKIVELARRATDIVVGETGGLHELQKLFYSCMGLDGETVNDILAKAFGKVEELAQQLLVEVDSQKDILTVMENANQALARINSTMETTLQGFLDNVEGLDQSLDDSYKQMAEGQPDVLGNILDAVAHEIRNPLLAIGGFSKRLAREAEGKGKGSEYAKIIAKESARLEGVLEEVTEYCQDYKPQLSEENVVQIAVRVLDEMEALIRQKNIQVIRGFPDEPVHVSVERKGVAKVIKQLVENAINVVQNKEGVLKVSILTEKEGEIFLDIADNGPSMPSEIRDALVDGNLSTKTFGRGLSMALARKIVEAHNGRIVLSIEEGKGNRISVALPTIA